MNLKIKIAAIGVVVSVALAPFVYGVTAAIVMGCVAIASVGIGFELSENGGL